MITPQDIQTKEFSKSMRGYNDEEVDLFLDEITTDLEAVLSELASTKAQLESANEKLAEYKSTESSVLQTLEAAKALMNDIAASAEKRAEILVKNAELDAELKNRQALENVERLKEEEQRLTEKVANLRSRFKSMLESEIERMDGFAEEVLGSASAGPVKPALSTADFFGSGSFLKKDDNLGHTMVNVRTE